MEVEIMVSIIIESLYMRDEDEEGERIIENITTYKDKGVLTGDAGIVIKLKDQKSVFYVTVTEQES